MLRLHAPVDDAPANHVLTLVGASDTETYDVATAEPSLSLVDQCASTDLKFNRRGYPRKVLTQEVTAVYTDDQGQRGVMRLGVIDGSWTGLGVVTPRDVPMGTRLSFCAPGTPVMTRHGEVVRREATSTGYRLGIKLDAKRSG